MPIVLFLMAGVPLSVVVHAQEGGFNVSEPEFILRYANGLDLTYVATGFDLLEDHTWDMASGRGIVRVVLDGQQESGGWPCTLHRIDWRSAKTGNDGLAQWVPVKRWWAGPQGPASFFGPVGQQRADLRPLTMGMVIGGHSLVPAFPIQAEAPGKVGDEWALNVPAVAYFPFQLEHPREGPMLLKQKWEETVEYEGYRCARISFAYKDQWVFDKSARCALNAMGMDLDWIDRTLTFEWSGNVYFAIDEGIVIGEESQVMYSRGDPDAEVPVGRKVQRLLISHRRSDAAAEPLRTTDWRWGQPIDGRMDSLRLRSDKPRAWSQSRQSDGDVPVPSGWQAVEKIVQVRTHKGEVVDRTITFYANPQGMEFVWIPPGEFTMGSAVAGGAHEEQAVARAYTDEKPLHKVELSRGFFLGATEVTEEQYSAVMWQHGPRNDSPQSPATGIAWNDAATYCARLCQRTGIRYELPTEAEWEYACRAGSSTPFNSGESICAEWVNYSGSAVYGVDGSGLERQGALPVASFPANEWGLYDIHGNVYEWCADFYDPDYYGVSPRKDPVGPSIGTSRVLRGGSWNDSSTSCRSANRLAGFPWSGFDFSGFRICYRPSQ